MLKKNVSELNAYFRLATNDVRVASCSAIFDARKGFTGKALMPTVLNIEKNNSDKKDVK